MRRIWRDPLREWLIVLAITALATSLRFLALDSLPPGLYHDEAFNGLDALQVLSGSRPIFFEANNGREPLFIYLAAAGVALLGRTPGALRLISALAGTLLIPATYLLGRSLYNRRAAICAAVLAATTVWTLNLSRMAFRAGLLPLCSALMLALLWRGLQRRRPASMLWAGVAAGACLYTYLAARFIPLALLLFLVYALLWRRELLWWRGWAVFAVSAALVASPLAIYLLRHWDSTLGRAEQVSVLNAAINGGDLWGTLVRNAWRTALAAVWRGDFIPRHDIPLRPVFEPLMALAALAGLGLVIARARRMPAHVLVLLWLAVMCLPTVLAEGAPHMLRGVGVLPVLLLLPALGLDAFVDGLGRLVRSPAVGAAIAAVALVLAAGQNCWAYWQHLHGEAVYYNFEAGATRLATEINTFLGTGWQGAGLSTRAVQISAGRAVYLAGRLWENWASLRYLVPASDALHLLNGSALGEAEPERDVLVVAWPYEDSGEALKALPAGQLISVEEGARERGDLEAESRLLYVSYRSQPVGVLPRSTQARWEQGIRLLGYALEPLDGDRLQVDLYWQTDAPLAASYTVFCHALQDGIQTGQHDGPACQGYYGTERWRVGDVVRDRHVIALSSAWYATSGQVAVGLYRWETMQRLALLDSRGQPGPDTAITLTGGAE